MVLGRDTDPKRHRLLVRHLHEAPLGLGTIVSQVEPSAQSLVEACLFGTSATPDPGKNLPRMCLEWRVPLKREMTGGDLLYNRMKGGKNDSKCMVWHLGGRWCLPLRKGHTEGWGLLSVRV